MRVWCALSASSQSRRREIQERRDQQAGLVRLGDEGIGAGVASRLLVAGERVGSQDHDARPSRTIRHLSGKVEAVAVGQPDVEQDEVERLASQQGE